MIVHKSFKYDDEKHPKVHQWFLDLTNEGKDYSEAIRRLIEGDCQNQDRILGELAAIRQQLAGLKVAASTAPMEEAALIEIEEIEGAVREVEEKPEVKAVNKGLLKSRYGL